MATLVSTVWVQKDHATEPESFGPGEADVPAWALKKMGAHCFVDGEHPGAGDDAEKPYSEWKKADLEDEVATRNEGRANGDLIEVEAPGNKAELVAALEADDAAHA